MKTPQEYLDKGFNITPCGKTDPKTGEYNSKAPKLLGWQKHTATAKDFNGNAAPFWSPEENHEEYLGSAHIMNLTDQGSTEISFGGSAFTIISIDIFAYTGVVFKLFRYMYPALLVTDSINCS